MTTCGWLRHKTCLLDGMIMIKQNIALPAGLITTASAVGIIIIIVIFFLIITAQASNEYC